MIKLLLILPLLCFPAYAITYVEDVDGEFSADRLNPTPIVLDTLSSNNISGQMGTSNGLTDLEYFSVIVPTGFQIESIFLLGYINNADDGGVSFWALDDEAIFSVSPSEADAAATDFLGWSHLTSAPPDQNLLSTFSNSPLPSGSYTFWLQETGEGTVDYGIEINLTPVPEPHSAILTIFGLSILLTKRLRTS